MKPSTSLGDAASEVSSAASAAPLVETLFSAMAAKPQVRSPHFEPDTEWPIARESARGDVSLCAMLQPDRASDRAESKLEYEGVNAYKGLLSLPAA